MMHSPWDCAQPDEWLPRSLRLCWGGDSSDGSGGFGGAATGGGDWGSAGSGGFGGSDFGGGPGGWGADSFGGAATGGGDWGSAGAYDAGGMSGYTDAASYAAALASSPGGFYDTGGAGLAPGALGAEFGGTFGLGGISGQPGDPMGAFGAELDAGGGGLSGVGRAIESWGRDTPATQAGYVGSFADLSGGFGGVGSPGTGGSYTGTGGGLFGDYGGGYTGGGRSGGFTGGGFTGGGSTGGGSSGGRSSGGSFTSSAAKGGVTSPYADDTGPQGRGESEVSSPYADDTGPTGRGEQDTVEGAPEADTPAPSTFGTPATSHDTTMESGQAEAPTSTDDTTTIGGDPALSGASVQDAPSAFGPQSLDRGTPDYQGAPYADMVGQPSQAYTEGLQALSDLTQSALTAQPTDYQGSPYANMGPQGEAFSDYQGPFAGPDVGPDRGAYTQGQWGDLPGIYSQGISNVVSNWAQNQPSWAATREILSNPATWFSPTNQQTFNEIANLPGTLYSALNPSVPTMLQAPSTMDLQALGEQDKAGQITDLATQLGEPDIGAPQGLDPGAEQYGTESYAPGGIDPGAAQYATAPDPATQLGIESIDPVAWGSVFEGAAPDLGGYDPAADQASYDFGGWGQPYGQTDFGGWADAPGGWDFGGWADTPAVDTTMESGQATATPSTDDTATPGGDPALSGASVDAANAAANAAKDAGASQQAADAAAAAAAAAAARGGDPAEQANAAGAAARENGATPEQANAIANGVYDAASRGPTPEISGKPGAPPGLLLEMLTSPEVRSFLTAYDPATMAIGAVNQAMLAPTTREQPAAPPPPTGPEPESEATGTQTTIPGGRTTDFNYPTSSTPPPGLLEQAQPSTSATIPGDRTTDFNYPSSSTPPPPSTALPPVDQPLPGMPAGQPEGQPGVGIRGAYDAPSWQGPTTADRYLAGVYDRTSRKIDSTGDFTHKDPQSAARLGMDKLQYAIGGLDRDVKTIVEAMGKAMDRANVPWTITAAYRDNYRQGLITAGVRALPSGSWHGGTSTVPLEPSLRGGIKGEPQEGPNAATKEQIAKAGETYGLGRALDVTGVRGNQGQVWSWIDQNGSKFGISRPFGSRDPSHIQPIGDFRGLAEKIRSGFDPLTGKYQTADGKPDRNFARNQEAQDRAQREAAQQDIPQAQPGAPPADVPPAQPPATALPPVAPPEPAPAPADIPIDIPVQAPAPFMTPPTRGRLDPAVQTQHALNLIKQSTAKLTTASGQAEFNAAGVVAAKELAAAGVPLAMARSLMTDSAYKGAEKVGYGPSSMGWNALYKPAIDKGIEDALQGYKSAAPGPVQGPYGFQPDAPGKRSEAPFGQQFAGLSQSLGPTPQQPSIFSIPTLQQLSPLIAPPPPPLPAPNIRTEGGPQFGQQFAGFSPGGRPEAPPLGPTELGRAPPAPPFGLMDPNSIGAQGIPSILGLPSQPGAFMDAYGQVYGPRGLAKGGRVDDDEPVVVGEEGPEVFVPDRPGTVVPHMPPGGGGDFGRWPKLPTPDYPGRYAGVGREMKRQMRTAQDPVPGLMDMIDSGRLRLNAANWQRMINDPSLIALGRSRIEDRRAYSHDYPY